MTAENSEELFANHPVRAQMRTTISQARGVLEKPGAALDDNLRTRLMRLVALLEFSAEVIDRADPELAIGVGSLDLVKPQLDGIASVLPQVSAANPAAIKQPIANAEAILGLLARFPPRIVVDGTAELAKMVSGLKGQQEVILSEATAKASTAVQFVETAQKAAEKDISQKAAAAAELATTVERLQQQIGQQSARLDEALAKFTASTGALEQQRESRYQDWLDKQAEAFATRSNNEVAKVTALLEQTTEDAASGVSTIKKNLADARRILNVIGNDATTGNYKKAASSNARSAEFLRGGAIILFLVMVGVVLWLAHSAINREIGWDVAVFRLFSILVLALPAAYLARESSRQRDVADRLRRMELELASIDAFNALLPKEKQDEIKAEMARKYFGNFQPEPAPASSTEPPLTLKEFLKYLSSVIRAVKK